MNIFPDLQNEQVYTIGSFICSLGITSWVSRLLRHEFINWRVIPLFTLLVLFAGGVGGLLGGLCISILIILGKLLYASLGTGVIYGSLSAIVAIVLGVLAPDKYLVQRWMPNWKRYTLAKAEREVWLADLADRGWDRSLAKYHIKSCRSGRRGSMYQTEYQYSWERPVPVIKPTVDHAMTEALKEVERIAPTPLDELLPQR